jgi:hypothetical protein
MFYDSETKYWYIVENMWYILYHCEPGEHAYHNSTYQVPKGRFIHWIVLLIVDKKKWFCVLKHQFKYGIHLHSRLKSTVNFKKRKVSCLQCQVFGSVLYIWLFALAWFTLCTINCKTKYYWIQKLGQRSNWYRKQ